MRVTIRKGNVARHAAGAVAIGVFEGAPLGGAAAAVDRATRGAIRTLIRRGDFRGKWLETAVLYPRGLGVPRLILVGLGAKGSFDSTRARQASAIASRRAAELESASLATVAFGAGAGGLDPERAAQSTAEGAVLGTYRFTAYRSHSTPSRLRRVEIVESDPARAAALGDAVARGARWSGATCLARDLANTPGQDLTPERLADRAREIGRDAGAKVEVFSVPQLERLGMGALLAVGRGSVHPPRFVVLDRPGDDSSAETVVVVGKGITFDTGGISLKPRENMNRMKYDMSGAAAVMALFDALPSLAPPFRVVGLVAAAENMPGGRALKPGDIVRAMDGTTIEVTNTDAEGRLVLADALTYARRYRPAAVVDLATLTGAISIALGNLAAGLFTAHDDLASELLAASEASGERLWRMPVSPEYLADMRGDVADLVNSTGAREGGAVLAASFLQHFARGMPWAHLDIASTAWSPVDRPHERRGPTGFGVRLLLEWLSRRASAPRAASSPPAPRAPRAGRTARGRAAASSRPGSPRARKSSRDR